MPPTKRPSLARRGVYTVGAIIARVGDFVAIDSRVGVGRSEQRITAIYEGRFLEVESRRGRMSQVMLSAVVAWRPGAALLGGRRELQVAQVWTDAPYNRHEREIDL